MSFRKALQTATGQQLSRPFDRHRIAMLENCALISIPLRVTAEQFSADEAFHIASLRLSRMRSNIRAIGEFS